MKYKSENEIMWVRNTSLPFREGWGGLGGGFTNTIGGTQRTAPYSVIGGGRDNNIFDDVNVIGGGEKNTINVGAQHSFIGGGIGNTVNANCGAVLGGQGNTVNHAYAAVFGNGLATAAPDMLHVSCLNAVNSPNWATFPVPGTLAFINVTAAMVGVGFPPGARIAMIA